MNRIKKIVLKLILGFINNHIKQTEMNDHVEELICNRIIPYLSSYCKPTILNISNSILLRKYLLQFTDNEKIEFQIDYDPINKQVSFTLIECTIIHFDVASKILDMLYTLLVSNSIDISSYFELDYKNSTGNLYI
jgi:hypothetical protein